MVGNSVPVDENTAVDDNTAVDETTAVENTTATNYLRDMLSWLLYRRDELQQGFNGADAAIQTHFDELNARIQNIEADLVRDLSLLANPLIFFLSFFSVIYVSLTLSNRPLPTSPPTTTSSTPSSPKITTCETGHADSPTSSTEPEPSATKPTAGAPTPPGHTRKPVASATTPSASATMFVASATKRSK